MTHDGGTDHVPGPGDPRGDPDGQDLQVILDVRVPGGFDDLVNLRLPLGDEDLFQVQVNDPGVFLGVDRLLQDHLKLGDNGHI